MINLTGANAAAAARGWYLLNNVWNPGSLIQGTDYTINGTYDPNNVAQGTGYAWSFPVNNATVLPIRAYPELIFGPAPKKGGGPFNGVFPVRVGDISTLTSNYNVTYGGNTSGYNVSYDIWLTSTPGAGSASITNEVMVWLHMGNFKPAGSVVGTYSDANFSGTIYHSDAMHYTAFVANGDRRAGTVDIASMLHKLEGMGIISSSEYLANIELGAEVASGSGSLVFNNFDIRLQTKGVDGPATKSAVTGMGVFNNYIQGGAGDDRLYPAAGTSLVDGGAGDDTVVMSGPSATYTITRNTDGTLTAAGGGQTVTLVNDQFIAFSDRTISTTPGRAAALDFNDDLSSDIVWRNDDGRVLIWDMRDGTPTTGAMLPNPGLNWTINATGDFNGDGASDIVLQSSGGQAMLWLVQGNAVIYNGPALWANGTAASSPGAGWQVRGAGDFNGDGDADILWRNADGQVQIWFMAGQKVGAVRNVTGGAPASWSVAETGDFNGDGKSDILWNNGSAGLQLWTMDGSAIASSAFAGNIGSGAHVLAAGDFNGDGKADLLTNVDNGPAGVWLMNGAQRTYAGLVTDATGTALGRPSTNWHVASAGDYNGDGKTDILWENTAGQLQVWTMSGQVRISAANIGSQSTMWHAAIGV